MKTIGIPRNHYSTSKMWTPFLKWLFNFQVDVIDIDPKFGLDNRLPEVDIVLFDGGADVHPLLYSGVFHKTIQTNIGRDWNERIIFEFYRDKPTLFAGICRGAQFLNVMCGGNLWADLPSEKKAHDLFHRAVVLPDTSLAEHLKIKPKKSAEIDIAVNSYHHQAVKDLAPTLRPVLIEPETNIIEGFESIGGVLKNAKIRAVQSHPEYGDKEFELRTEICGWLLRIEK